MIILIEIADKKINKENSKTFDSIWQMVDYLKSKNEIISLVKNGYDNTGHYSQITTSKNLVDIGFWRMYENINT